MHRETRESLQWILNRIRDELAKTVEREEALANELRHVSGEAEELRTRMRAITDDLAS